MGESLSRRSAASSENIRTIVRSNFEREKSSKFGRVVIALWPTKPALNLAQRIGCTERAAQLYINGQRKPNARAALVLLAEIIVSD